MSVFLTFHQGFGRRAEFLISKRVDCSVLRKRNRVNYRYNTKNNFEICNVGIKASSIKLN